VEVTSDTPLVQIAKLLAEHKILSVPVKGTDHKYIGWIDTLELVRFAVRQIKDEECRYKDSFASELFASLEFATATASDVLAQSKRATQCVNIFPSNTSMDSVMKELTLKHQHRALVHKGGSQDYFLISQTDIARFLLKNKNLLEPDVNQATLSSLGLVNPLGSPVFIASTFDKAITAFLKMVDNDIYAVGVLDEHGKLVANLSASDLRGLVPDKMYTLNLPIMEFFQSRVGQPPHPITCSPDDVLEEVLLKTCPAHVHRVWVVDSAQRPLGVVTLTDVVKSILRICESKQS